MGVIESNAVEVDGTSPGIASLACQIVSSESEITDTAAVRERRRRIPANPKLNLLNVIDTRARDPDPSGGDDQESSWQRKTDTHSLNRVVGTLTAAIDAADFSSDEKEKLVALVQSRQSSNNDENEFPGHGSDMIDVLTDLQKKGSNRARPHSSLRVTRCTRFCDADAVPRGSADSGQQGLGKTKEENTEFASALAAAEADIVKGVSGCKQEHLQLSGNGSRDIGEGVCGGAEGSRRCDTSDPRSLEVVVIVRKRTQKEPGLDPIAKIKRT